MLSGIFDIVAPVFLVIGAGYLAVWRGWFADRLVDGLMKFAIQFAVPCLLFRATSTMDLGSAYDWRLMSGFYIGSTTSFTIATLLTWRMFGRRPGEAVAVGFGALFSNLVLMGLPISQRAWGADTDAMATAYAIVSVHAPFCYLLGITSMELLRADGRSLPDTVRVVVRAMFRNSLMIGIGLGFIVNLSGLALPGVVESAVDTVARAALPVALFGLGGTLTRYAIKDAVGEAATVSTMSLVIHPMVSLLVCRVLDAPDELTKAVVLMAAMAPGINSYLFASMYDRGQATAASTVLLGTAMSIFSVSVWLWLLRMI
ncbi:MAG: AEC family transporter [Gammaproteobacteria bacterium]|nr:AEC family transporter [Gammaproteobacteria bacterium]MCB1924972.1 AEC family transporter [Gammaproteobacteria bacterium]